MKLNLNKAIINSLVLEFAEAVSRSHSSRDVFLRTIANSHPEITYSQEDWDNIDEDVKEKILARIRKTLVAI